MSGEFSPHAASLRGGTAYNCRMQMRYALILLVACAIGGAAIQAVAATPAVEGKVTAVDRATYPERASVYWTRRAEFPTIGTGAVVYINGVQYKTIVNSNIGGVYLPASAKVAPGDTIAFAVMPSPSKRNCAFNGDTIAHGGSITAYKAASVAAGSTCASEKRTCNDSKLSGSYAYATCKVNPAAPAPKSCVFNGKTVASGSSVTAYQAASVPAGSVCVKQARTCTNGTLSGTYTFDSCTVSPAAPATVTITAPDPWANESGSANGDYTITRTGSTAAALTVSFTVSGSATRNTDYTLSGGGLSSSGTTVSIPKGAASVGIVLTTKQDTANEGEEVATLTLKAGSGYVLGSSSSASVRIADDDAAGKGCSVNGVSFAHGETRTLYSQPNMPAGETCKSQARTCTNGTLSGSDVYNWATCAVTPPAAPKNCNVGSIVVEHGKSRVFFKDDTPAPGVKCESHMRTCTSGVLSGTYTKGRCDERPAPKASCTVNVRSTDVKEGVAKGDWPSYARLTSKDVTMKDGDTKQLYKSPYAVPGEECQPETRRCTDGTMSGTYQYDSCVKLPATATQTTRELSRSDVLISPRFELAHTMPKVFLAAQANRIVWTYGENYQNQLKGSIPVQEGIPNDPPSAAASCNGTDVDVTTQAWKDHILTWAKKRIDLGTRSFHLDDPHKVFTVCASESEVKTYFSWFNSQVRAYAASKYPGEKITFSANLMGPARNINAQAWVRPYFDFALAEVYDTDVFSMLGHMMPIFTDYAPYVSGITIANEDKLVNQRGIAAAYAFGVLPIVPWDVYLSGNYRFYGNPSDYAAYYHMVRQNKLLFDNYPLVTTANINNAAVVASPAMRTTIRVHKSDSQKKAVHLVNMSGTSANLTVKLKKADFPNPPNRVVRPESPTPKAITPTQDSTYYIYNVGSVGIWTVLFRADSTADASGEIEEMQLASAASGWQQIVNLISETWRRLTQ